MFPFLDVEEGEPHAARAVVGLERHAAVALELAPRGGRIDAECRELGVAIAAARIVLDREEELSTSGGGLRPWSSGRHLRQGR